MKELLIFYAFGALYFFGEVALRKEERGGYLLVFLCALIWPISVAFVGDLIARGASPAQDRNDDSRPFEEWKPKPPGGDYNSNNLGREKGEGPEDMEAFIKALELRPDAPLPHELTFSYKLTGISKTYPAGTMFPSALLKDWKAGYFMGHSKADESFEN